MHRRTLCDALGKYAERQPGIQCQHAAAHDACRLSFTPLVAGMYNVSISLSGQVVGRQTQYAIEVSPAGFNAASSQLAGYSSSVPAGMPATLFFRSFDQYGNLYSMGDLAFSVTATCLQPPSRVHGTVTAVADEPGLYQGVFTATIACIYTVNVTHTAAIAHTLSDSSMADTNVTAVSLQLLVQSAVPIPYRSSVEGPGVWASTVGLPSNFSVCLALYCPMFVSIPPDDCAPYSTLTAFIPTHPAIEWRNWHAWINRLLLADCMCWLGRPLMGNP